MQLADSMSVAKIKIIYASTQRAHSYDANQWQLHYPFAEQASQING